MIRNVILDWSGTVVDDLPAVLEATNFVFQKAGVPDISLEDFREQFQLPFKGFYDRMIPHVALDDLETWFHQRYREVQDSVDALPHAHNFLEFCQQNGIRLFVLSTVQEPHFRVQAEQNRLHHFFEQTFLGVNDKRTRIREILERHKLHPEETLMVGDMTHDIETARTGGVRSCAVLTGYTPLPALRESRPDLIVEHLGELLDHLQSELLRSGINGSNPDRMPVVTVGALIYDKNDRVLMVRTHKWSNLWGIPGGKIKYGEDSTAALRRELKEETGLDIENIQLVLVQDCIQSTEFYREEHFVLLNYTCRVTGAPTVRLNDEARDFQWITPEAALALTLNKPTRLLLDIVNNATTGQAASEPGLYHHITPE